MLYIWHNMYMLHVHVYLYIHLFFGYTCRLVNVSTYVLCYCLQRAGVMGTQGFGPSEAQFLMRTPEFMTYENIKERWFQLWKLEMVKMEVHGSMIHSMPHSYSPILWSQLNCIPYIWWDYFWLSNYQTWAPGWLGVAHPRFCFGCVFLQDNTSK